MAKKDKSTKRVGFLLDETGSMQSRREETIVAVNNYFKTLRKEKAIVTFATFDTEQGVNFRHIDTPAKKIDDLTLKTYVPNAMTPLHDAVGKMVGMLQNHVNKNDKVLVVVVTDGQENSSREFDLSTVQNLIAKQEGEGWAFAYIGATPDAWGGGARMGMASGSVLHVAGNQMRSAMKAHSAATADYFSGRASARDLYAKSRDIVEKDNDNDR